MSQNDFTLANQSFPAFRADLNLALQALATNNSGGSAPSTTFANMWWYDSSNNIMYIRNEDNDAWIKFAELDQANDKFVLSGTLQLDDGTVSAPALTFNSDTNMGIYRGGTDILKFVTAGTDAVTINASQNTTFAGEVTADDLNLSVGTGGDGIQITSTGANYLNIGLDTNRTGASQTLTQMEQKWNGTTVARINFNTGTDTTNKDDGEIRLQTASAGTPLNRIRIENNGDISFYEDTGTTPKLFWDASEERLGLGTASPTSTLEVIGGQLRVANSSASSMFLVNPSSTYADGVDLQATYNGGGSFGPMKFSTGGSETMRIDSSGNLLVGTTDSSPYNNTSGTGFAVDSGGYFSVTREGVVGYFNRNTSDGDIVHFRKDGTTVGSIGTQNANRFHIANPNIGLTFNQSNYIMPSNGSGAENDNSVDLGKTNSRFDDIYATNGTIQTSDQQEKNTITDSDLGIDFIKRLTPKSYIFNGKTRTHYGLIAQDVETVLSDISKPTSGFAGFIKDDISEEQDGSEYRYGLRYTEFVAPLIQAVKDQQATIDALTARITALENGE